jgi:GNAT superfamily N-acetyltransferase
MAEIREIGLDEIDVVEPLWFSLLQHHGSIAPQMPPIRQRGDSWRLRRKLYEQWLSEPDAFAFVAYADDEPVGYALVKIDDADDTWDSGTRWAELETLAVVPAARGAGVGSLLFDAVDERLASLGIEDLLVGVVGTNVDALRFYERRGMMPYWQTLYRRGAGGANS